jgi:DNA-directed RNA polymerase subunit RPC12/RpoP
MSLFSMSQCENMVREFWLSGRTSCPCDGTPVLTQLHDHSVNYLLVLACPICGKKAQVTRFSDPSRDQFRRWTMDEREQLATAHADGDVKACPVCSAKLRYESSLHSTLLLIECPRCGNGHQTSNSWQFSPAKVSPGIAAQA